MPKRSFLRNGLIGLIFGFLHAALFRELSQKIPINFFFPHFLALAFTGTAAGLLFGKKANVWVKKHPYGLVGFLLVFLLGIWVYHGDSIFFWTLALYYPMPIPEYGWIKAFFFLVALVSLPLLFFLLACSLSEALQTSLRPGQTLFLFFFGFAVGNLLGYPAQFLGSEVMLLLGCMALLVLHVSRPGPWAFAILGAGAILLYGARKNHYPILLSLKDYRLIESRITDNYKVDFYAFRNDTCVAQAVNEFLHVYTCRKAQDHPVELSYLNRVLSKGLRDYRVLIVGCSIGLYPYELLDANPSMKKCVLVDVDPQMTESVRKAQEDIGMRLYEDGRFVLRSDEPRHYLDHETEDYDLLYLHRIGNALIFYPYTLVPVEYYLLTEEALDRIFHHLLKEDGVYIMDWGIPSEWEVRQFVASFPKDVHFRPFWTTLSNQPLSGAPLIFVLASRSEERLNDVASRLKQATYFHEVKSDHWPSFYRTTDDKPWLKYEVVVALTLLLVPFCLPLFVLFRKTRCLATSPVWAPGGHRRRYYLLLGLAFALFNAFSLGRVTRVSPFGITPGWFYVEAIWLLGFALGVLVPVFGRFLSRGKWAFLFFAFLMGLDIYLLDTIGSFPSALLLLAALGFLLGEAFALFLPATPASEQNLLFGFHWMGAAAGIALFQASALVLGFLATGFLASFLVSLAGWRYVGTRSAA